MNESVLSVVKDGRWKPLLLVSLTRECGLGVDAVLTISQPWTNKKLLESNSNLISSKKFIKVP